MKVYVKGQGEVNLTQQHFVATGGQASVYVRDGVAYKIYTNRKDAIPYEKFKALEAIHDPCVIRPSQLLLDAKNVTVGYAMEAVADNLSLCQLFTKAFRDRHHVTTDQIVDVAATLREHIGNVHAAGVLIVDLNELNILVPRGFDETFLIDVDSYQTGGFPATVIMPSVRDWSAKAFSELSDWFSYAVLAFQLFVGSHPFKGTHAASTNVEKDKRLEHRMRNNLSAFRKDVSLPKCCYPFDAIPETFRDWLKAVLDDGKRLLPPDPKGGPIAALVSQTRPMTSTGKLDVTLVTSFDGWDVIGVAESSGHTLAIVEGRGYRRFTIDGVSRIALGDAIELGPIVAHGTTLLGFTPKMSRPVAMNLHENCLTFIDLERGATTALEIRADELARSGDRFYIRSGTQVLEVEFSELVSKTIVTASHCVADVLAMASHLYEGCVIQNMLGSVFASVFPRSKAGYQVRIKELDSYKPIDAKFDGGVLMVLGAKQGRYDRLIFRFDGEYSGYDLRVVNDVSPSGLNFITLATGICVVLTEEETLEAFSARKGASGIRVVEDAALGNDMRLTRVAGRAGFTRGDKVYQISLK